HAAERAPLEELLQVFGVGARRVEKARVAVVAFDQPESAALDAERVAGIKHRHTRGVERGEARPEARLTDVAHDGIEQIDHATEDASVLAARGTASARALRSIRSQGTASS